MARLLLTPAPAMLNGPPTSLGDLELLALVLGGPGARAAAAELVERYGPLATVARTPPRQLTAVPGVGPARAARLAASLELARRGAHPPADRRQPIRDPADAARWFVPALAGLDHEELHALYVDQRKRPIVYRRLTTGSESATVVDVRQVLRHAIEAGASGMLVAHNHPSGELTPSGADLDVTRRLRAAGNTVGIELIDHLLVARDRWARVGSY